MAVITSTPSEIKKSLRNNTLVRVSRYVAMRLLILGMTVVVSVYLTILIANMGGYVDTIMRNEIADQITQAIAANPAMQQMEPEARRKLIEERIASAEKRLGLDTPIAIRSFRYLSNAFTLRLGRAINMTSDAGSKQVRLILLERLPATLLLMGVSQLFLFFSSVFLALNLSRRYGNFWDKLVVALSPTSAVPPWFYGIFMILIFAAVLKVLPFGRMVSSPPPDNLLDYSLSLLQHLTLPALSALAVNRVRFRRALQDVRPRCPEDEVRQHHDRHDRADGRAHGRRGCSPVQVIHDATSPAPPIRSDGLAISTASYRTGSIARAIDAGDHPWFCVTR